MSHWESKLLTDFEKVIADIVRRRKKKLKKKLKDVYIDVLVDKRQFKVAPDLAQKAIQGAI